MSKFKKKIILCFLLLLPIYAFSQNATKGFQLLKQQKHSNAIEAFNKAIGKKRDILASKFGLAVIYSDTTYKRYRYSRAYKHIAYIEKRYVKLPGSEKEILRKDYITKAANTKQNIIPNQQVQLMNSVKTSWKQKNLVNSFVRS